MKLPRIIERAIYALVVVLSLVALWLVLNAPSSFLNVHVVYQGF
jgi:hypothetical protein